MILIIVVAVVAAVMVVGFGRTVRIVPQARAYVVERLGSYSRTLDAGLNSVVPFIDRVRRGSTCGSRSCRSRPSRSSPRTTWSSTSTRHGLVLPGLRRQAEVLLGLARATIDLGVARRLRNLAAEFQDKADEFESDQADFSQMPSGGRGSSSDINRR